MPTAVKTLKRADGAQSRETTKAILLVGGLGTRLRSVLPSTPKTLASLGNKSFLELLIRQLRHQGIRRLVLCTGYLADQIEKQFGDGQAWDVEIEYSIEPNPLGTAGALKLAQRYIGGDCDFLVMNGDSFVEVNFDNLLQAHRTHGGLANMAVVEVNNAGRYGTVKVDDAGRVSAFFEKTSDDKPGLINAGVYVFNRAVLRYIPEGPASLERAVFPQILDEGVYALKQNGIFIDIGTPEDYARAQKLCDRLDEVASR
jgi:mannose-1-phosphate guanylyltransferase